MKEEILTKAIAHLVQDSNLASILDKDKVLFNYRETLDVYGSLIRSIIGQQVSIKAAAAIHQRFLDLVENNPTPQRIISLDEVTLKSVGLSRQKTSYIQNVAHFFYDNDLIAHHWEQESDEDIIKLLTQIKGVGKWTVQMILMFTLRREDVFPVDDLGIQKAMTKLYNLNTTGRQLRQEMTTIASTWQPYRTIACLYLWSWKDQEK